MHPYVEVAKKAISDYLKGKKTPTIPSDLPPEMQKKAGVFVCLKKSGQLRGCIGTFSPSCRNIFEEITKNAVSAANEDPRFPPVREDELQELAYSVDVLSEPSRVADISELDHTRYGVIVTKDFRRGLLLPDIEGVDSVQEQLKIAKLKAGIDPADEDVVIFKFTVERYK
jgi:AmmeMemoRadiSam system protein A